jgi:hypothetical protein
VKANRDDSLHSWKKILKADGSFGIMEESNEDNEDITPGENSVGTPFEIAKNKLNLDSFEEEFDNNCGSPFRPSKLLEK